jgi:polyhydroxybutyrate depolymerase
LELIMARSWFTFILVALAASTAVSAEERVSGDAIRDRIRQRMEQRRTDRVPPLGTATKAPTGGPGYESVLIAGQVRTFMRYTPNAVLVAGKKVPVVFALHGGKSRADQLQGYLGMNVVADREGFVVVYPQGDKGRWNDGRTVAVNGGAEVSTLDDLGFLNGLADALVAQGIADPERLYIMGLSNGGFMSLALACSKESRFAAYGAVISSIPLAAKDGCKPSLPLRAVMINGSDDKLIRYDGAAGRFGLKGNLAPPEAAAHLAALAGCAGPADTALPDRDPKDGTTVSKRAWASCPGQSRVEFYTVKGGGHQSPSTGKTTGGVAMDALLGTRSHDIDTAETVWDFFKRSSR